MAFPCVELCDWYVQPQVVSLPPRPCFIQAETSGEFMLRLAIAIGLLCFMSGSSIAATQGEEQAASFTRLYSSLCLKHANSMGALREKLVPAPKLPSAKAAHFLGGREGDAWPIPDNYGKFVLTLLAGDNFCAVYARRADADAVESQFAALVATAPPPLVARQVQDEYAQTSANGQTHTVAYEWSVPNARRRMLFTLTTASSATAQIQALGSVAVIRQ